MLHHHCAAMDLISHWVRAAPERPKRYWLPHLRAQEPVRHEESHTAGSGTQQWDQSPHYTDTRQTGAHLSHRADINVCEGSTLVLSWSTSCVESFRSQVSKTGGLVSITPAQTYNEEKKMRHLSRFVHWTDKWVWSKVLDPVLQVTTHIKHYLRSKQTRCDRNWNRRHTWPGWRISACFNTFIHDESNRSVKRESPPNLAGFQTYRAIFFTLSLLCNHSSYFILTCTVRIFIPEIKLQWILDHQNQVWRHDLIKWKA